MRLGANPSSSDAMTKLPKYAEGNFAAAAEANKFGGLNLHVCSSFD